MTDREPIEAGPPAREPVFNAPLALLLLAGSFLLVHLVIGFLGPEGRLITARYALSDVSLSQGRWLTLVTFNFLHGDWMHVGLNSAFGVAFGAAVARLFGRDLRGSLVFLAFFLACGVVAGLGQSALAPDAPWAIIGASGGVSGFAGATARMLNPGGRLGPPWGRGFLGMTLGWIVLNALMGVTAIGELFSGGATIAWQAHLFGYAAGVALVGLFWRLAGAREPITQ